MKPFKEVIDGIRKAVMASEVREDIAQMGEYVEQFANTAGENIQKAIDPTLSLSGKAADAKATGDKFNVTPEITQYFYNDALIDFNAEFNSSSINFIDGEQNAINAPFQKWETSGVWVLENVNLRVYQLQIFYNCAKNKYRSAYRARQKGADWDTWSISSGDLTNTHNFNAPIDFNINANENSITLFNISNKNVLNAPFDDWKDSDTWVLENIYTEEQQFQCVKCLQNPFKRQAYRVFGQNWTIYNGNTVVCGEGTSIPDIEQGIARGEATGATVIVRPGNYDLIKMLNISDTNKRSGIRLYNGVHVIFEAGSYVTAKYSGSDTWYHTNFEPFYASGDFTLEGLNIQCQNTRYCVHCEFGGEGTHTYKFINCNMEYTETDGETWSSTCIGTGLGLHDYLVISGGSYQNLLSTTIIGRTEEQSYRPIWIHNGMSQGCDSKVYIDNVYLPALGHVELSSYGTSTINTLVQISNSKFGVDVVENFASPSYTTKNINCVKYNNTIEHS